MRTSLRAAALESDGATAGMRRTIPVLWFGMQTIERTRAERDGQAAGRAARGGCLSGAERRRAILGLALPIIGGMASQNVLNLVDTAMVGVLGSAPLAAVGLASFANFMACAFIMGLSAGVQAMASRRLGEGRNDEAAAPLNGGLLLAALLAVPLSLALVAAAPKLFEWLASDPEVVALGVPYLQARLVAMTALGMNFAFRGYWNGVGLSKVYMRTLIAMHALNIVLNWLLIFGHLGLPALGTTGAGIGSAVATFAGTLLYLAQGLRIARPNGFLASLPTRQTVVTMLRLSGPAGIQQFFFAAGMTALFWIIGRIGTAELAASNVLVQLLLVAILPGIGFGMASATLVGQALGRRDPDGAHRWAWDVVRLAVLVVFAISTIGFVFPDLLLRLFMHEPEALALARAPLRILAVAMPLDTVGLVLLNSLLGAGDTRRVMMVSVLLQWLVFLPAAWLVGPRLGLGLVGVWLAHACYRALQTTAFVVVWERQTWAAVDV
jgi:putative MATE family efflux protein